MSVGTTPGKKLRTNVAKNGDTNPTWNFPMRFTFTDDFSPTVENRQRLIVEIKAVGGIFGDKHLGKVCYVFNKRTKAIKGKKYDIFNSPVLRPSGEEKGHLTISYFISREYRHQQPPVTNNPVNALQASLIGALAALLIAGAANGGGCRRCECGGGGTTGGMLSRRIGEKFSIEAAKKEPGNDDLVDGAQPPAAGLRVAGAGNRGCGCRCGGCTAVRET